MRTDLKKSARVLEEWLPKRPLPDAIHGRLCRMAGLDESLDPYLIPTQQAHIAALCSLLKREEQMREFREREAGWIDTLARERLCLEENVLALQKALQRTEDTYSEELYSAWFLSEEVQRLRLSMESKQLTNADIESAISSLADTAKLLQEEAHEAEEKHKQFMEASQMAEKIQKLELERQTLMAQRTEGAAGIQ
ncbi:hypothetical protein RCL1_003975 [Eukaryota sp. TZLM3-RCL]